MGEYQSITPDIQNRNLEHAYHVACFDASALRVRLYGKPGSPIAKFNKFKSSFDFLAMLTSNINSMDDYKSLKTDVLTWLSTERTLPDREYMIRGIELFDKYQKTLNSIGIIKGM